MGSAFNLLENAMVISAAVPKDITGAVYNGDYVNMQDAEECWIGIQQGAWAGGTTYFTVGSGTTASGGSTAAVTDFTAWDGVALTDDQYAAATVTSGNLTMSTTANTFTLVRVKASAIPEGKKFIRGEVTTPGSNADLLSMFYILTGLKYQGKVPPTVIA